MSRMWVWCRRSLAAVAILVVVAWGVAAANEWLLRWRAEQLLADIRALEVNKSSLADAQALAKKWGKWADGGGCEAENCRFFFKIENRFPGDVSRWSERRPYWELHLLDRLGLRPAQIGAGIDVWQKIVVDKFFLVKIYLPERATWNPHLGESNMIGALADEGARLLPILDKKHSHPNRQSFQNREGLVAIFTPDEEPAESSQLMDFRFSCFTSLHHCTSQRELVPEMYDDWERDQKIGQSQSESCRVPYWMAARDWPSVLSADVISARKYSAYSDGSPMEPEWVVTLRPREVLKGKPPRTVAGTFSINLSVANFSSTSGSIFPYTSLIVAGRATREQDASLFPPMMLDGDECKVVEATSANLAAARQGVAKDFAAIPPED